MPAATETLRKKAFVRAVIAIALVVIIEIGAHFLLRAGNHSIASDTDLTRLVGRTGADTTAVVGSQPPGLAIPYLALPDGLLLYTMLLMVLGIVAPKDKLARLQGIGTLVVTILVILASIALLIVAVAKLVLMVSLFLAVPFGTIAYLILFGNFDTRGATVVLAVLMALKLFFCVQLVIGQQRFLQMKGLVTLVVTSLVCTVVVGILHGIVPTVLVSITDAIAAIVLAVVAIIWGVVLLIGAVISVVRAV